MKGKNLAIATKTQEIPKARDESKTYLSDKEELWSRKRIYIIWILVYMYFSFKFKKIWRCRYFFVKSEVCSQKRLTRVKNRMLSFRSRYQILTMARENVGKSRFLLRRVHKDDESTRKHQEKLNTGPKIKASLIRRSATDNCFTCCRLWSEILISYVRAANICLITSDFNWRKKASDGLRFLWKVLDQKFIL